MPLQRFHTKSKKVMQFNLGYSTSLATNIMNLLQIVVMDFKRLFSNWYSLLSFIILHPSEWTPRKSGLSEFVYVTCPVRCASIGFWVHLNYWGTISVTAIQNLFNLRFLHETHGLLYMCISMYTHMHIHSIQSCFQFL